MEGVTSTNSCVCELFDYVNMSFDLIKAQLGQVLKTMQLTFSLSFKEKLC